ncbi:MAG: metallophosphoesterase [Archangium sp.]|nr:metallophosphoesterase [Archangium sp.]
MHRFSLLAALLLASLVLAQSAPATFEAWEDQYQFDCNGPFEHFAPADVKTHGAFRYEHTGGTVKVRRTTPRKGKAAQLGALSGIKDLEPETQTMVTRFLADFERADVDAVIVGGDTASEPGELERILRFVAAATQRPILVIAGNMERAAALNHALLVVRKEGNPHLLNFDTIRRYDGEGVDVISIAGYFDRTYLHLSGGCIYKEKDLHAAERAAAAADDSVVLLSHGPPRQKGAQALDWVPGADNVGDPQLTTLIRDAKIPFGVFGHILEAGGTATDLAGKNLPQSALHSALYLNQGSANPLLWKMNDGSTAYGLAAILSVEGKKASYRVLRGPKP